MSAVCQCTKSAANKHLIQCVSDLEQASILFAPFLSNAHAVYAPHTGGTWMTVIKQWVSGRMDRQKNGGTNSIV